MVHIDADSHSQGGLQRNGLANVPGFSCAGRAKARSASAANRSWAAPLVVERIGKPFYRLEVVPSAMDTERNAKAPATVGAADAWTNLRI